MLRILLIVVCLAMSALAAPGDRVWKPEEIMVLIVGPSSNPITAQESLVVGRLAQLRTDYKLKGLKMATMHYDKPGEANYARKILGITAQDLPAVAVVQLDVKRGVPIKKLYVMPRVDQGSLESIDKVVKLWAGFTGSSVVGMAPVTLPSPARPGASPTPPPGTASYSTDGMLTMARLADDLTQSIVARQKDQPLRPDGRDQAARQSLLNLSENAHQLRQSFETHSGNPKEQLRQVLRRRQDFRASQPDVYLPLVVRSDTRRLFELLDQLEVIYNQLP